jgi:hypothetical protein
MPVIADGQRGKPKRRGYTRREALGLIAMGLATLVLAGCATKGSKRSQLATRLLREKYGREFDVVLEHPFYDTLRRPSADFCEQGADGLVFRMEFDTQAERIVWDTFVGRRLGRQVEELATDRLRASGIDSTSHVVVETTRLGGSSVEEADPEITLDGFLGKYGMMLMTWHLVITDEVADARSNPQFTEALVDLFKRLGSSLSRIIVYVVAADDLAEYRRQSLSLPVFAIDRQEIVERRVDMFFVNCRDDELLLTD